MEITSKRAGRCNYWEYTYGKTRETQEIASTVAFLASEEASYITGEDIDINGGQHMD